MFNICSAVTQRYVCVAGSKQAISWCDQSQHWGLPCSGTETSYLYPTGQWEIVVDKAEMGNGRVTQTDWDLLVLPLYATGQWEIVANESWDRDGQWQSESDRPRLLSLTFSDRSVRDCGYWDWDGQLQSEWDRWKPLTFIVYWTGQREIIIMADKVR